MREFLRRLDLAPAASSFEEVFVQVADILNAVENEMTDIPFDPANLQNDGRMYPTQEDSARLVAGRPDVQRFRSKAHNVLMGACVTIEIRNLSEVLVLSKAGSEGQTI